MDEPEEFTAGKIWAAAAVFVRIDNRIKTQKKEFYLLEMTSAVHFSWHYHSSCEKQEKSNNIWMFIFNAIFSTMLDVSAILGYVKKT